MKKLLASTLVVTTMFASTVFGQTIPAQNITVNGKASNLNVLNIEGRNFVNADDFLKVIGSDVTTKDTTTISFDGLSFTDGSDVYTVNGEEQKMDTAVTTKDGKFYLPVKYVLDGEGIGYTYDAQTKTTNISLDTAPVVPVEPAKQVSLQESLDRLNSADSLTCQTNASIKLSMSVLPEDMNMDMDLIQKYESVSTNPALAIQVHTQGNMAGESAEITMECYYKDGYFYINDGEGGKYKMEMPMDALVAENFKYLDTDTETMGEPVVTTDGNSTTFKFTIEGASIEDAFKNLQGAGMEDYTAMLEELEQYLTVSVSDMTYEIITDANGDITNFNIDFAVTYTVKENAELGLTEDVQMNIDAVTKTKVYDANSTKVSLPADLDSYVPMY